MLNQLVIVGRLASDPVSMTINGKKTGTITLASQRSYKNVDGVYETDFLEFMLYDGIIENVQNYCKKGDIVGVKGRVESVINSDNERIMRLVAEKVTFLSSRAKKEGEE